MIKIIGLGPGAKDALTIGTLELLKSSKNVYFRTEKHPTVDFLKEQGLKFETYDFAYDKFDSFDEVYEFIANEIIKTHNSCEDIVYGVPGHPFVAEKSVNILIKLCEKLDIKYEVLPAVSFVDAMMDALKLDPVEGLKIIDAFDMNNQVLDKRLGTIITQVYDPFIASEVKIKLSEYYKDDTEIYFVRAAGIKGLESIRKIQLYEIDRQEDIDYLTSLYIPKDLKNNKDFYDLLEIMEKLRSQEGCPWDREQTSESLKKYLIEESYEVLEAIDEQDDDKIIEELGDVLLQVVFHAQIGKEDGFFNINDVISSICNKMILRHPHVFSNKENITSDEVVQNWDEIKRKEKHFDTYTQEMKGIAKTLPSLLRADKVQNKAAKVGFDWNNVEDALSKVFEEFNEVKEVYKTKNKERILEEIGDLIFSSVNVSRFLDIDPEIALNKTTDKFINRFSFIEGKAREQGCDMNNMTLEEMDRLWNLAKINEKN